MSRRYPGIPEPEQSIESLHNTVLELKKLLEIVTQQSGDRRSQAVTFQDLLDRGLITLNHLNTNDNHPANLIADLSEEGDWTPSLTIGNDDTGITYNNRQGRYFRFKNLVNLWFVMDLTSIGGLTGERRCAGIPFDTENVSIPRVGDLTVANAAAGLSDQPWSLYAVNNSASIRLYRGDTGGTDFIHATDADISNTVFLVGSLSYLTTGYE